MDYILKYKKYKNKYLELKGGSLFSSFDRIVNKINEIRFKSNFVILRKIKFLQIIDTLYNNRYLINETFDYFFLYDNTKDIIYIFNKDGSQIKSQDEIQEFMGKMQIIKNKSSNMINFIGNLKENKILYQSIKNEMSCFNIDLTIINHRIDELNTILQIKCPTLQLKLDNYYNLDGNITKYGSDDVDMMILCLYDNDNCISSISFSYENNTIEINSKTNDKYQGKKYNTLLRAVLIMLAPDIICNHNNIKKLYSSAESPISAWLLISNFDVKIYSDEYEKFKKDKLIENPNISLKEIIFSFFENEEVTEIKLEVELVKANINKAKGLFMRLTNELNGILCPK